MLNISLVNAATLAFNIVLHDARSRKATGANLEQRKCLCGLLLVHRKLAEAVDELREAFLQKAKVVAHGVLQGLEALGSEVGLGVLSRQGEDVEDDLPAGPDEFRLLLAKSSDAHDHVFLDLLLARGQVVQHDGLERPQEHLLVAEILSLLFLKEFGSKLP